MTGLLVSPASSSRYTCIQNMKLVTNKFKSGGLHEKHVVVTWNLGNHLRFCFIVVTCSKVLFFKYILMSFTSFRVLLDINITLDFSSLKPTLFLFDHAVILLISKFEKFSALLTVSPLITSIRSSANTTSFVRLVNLRFSKEFY